MDISIQPWGKYCTTYDCKCSGLRCFSVAMLVDKPSFNPIIAGTRKKQAATLKSQNI